MKLLVSEVHMLRIGDFSRLSQVTIKALRYYDDLGLLKPISIDKFTGYRYYSIEQLPRIHRIMALKELGLSLEQIAVVLDDELATEQIRQILRLQQSQIEQRIEEERAQLAQVEFRLRMIELEDKMPKLDVIVRQIPPMRALTIRTSIGQGHSVSRLLSFQLEIEQALGQHHIKLVSPWTMIFYEEEFKLDLQDVESVLPVDDTQTEDVPLETAGMVRLTTVPALPMAATYIQRGFDRPGTPDVSEIMVILQRWIVDNGYRLCGTHRLVHHFGPLEHAEYEDWITEFQHEIEPAE